MLRARDWRHWRLRDYLLVFGPALVLTTVALVVAIKLVEPAPPRRIVLATGRADGAYHQFGLRYQAALAREGVTVVLRPTSGSVENLRLLADPASGVSVAFVQGGVRAAAPAGDLLALGSLYFEPMWLFARPALGVQDVRELRGRRIAVGPEGSGTRALIEVLLAANGIGTGVATFLPITGLDALRALRTGEVDVVTLVAGPESPTVREAMTMPEAELLTFARAPAYARRFPYLSHLTLPQGALSLERNLPGKDIEFLAPTAGLVVRADFHPALSDLLLMTALELHGRPGLFERARQFPSPDFTEFPLSDEALRFYRNGGPPFLQRYLPFWAATGVDRLKVMLLPLAVLLIPLFKIVPPTYRWQIRRKIYRWYSQVHDIDVVLCEPQTAEELDRLLAKVDHLEHLVRQIPIPAAHAEAHFHLRLHIDLVRSKIRAAREALPPPSKG